MQVLARSIKHHGWYYNPIMCHRLPDGRYQNWHGITRIGAAQLAKVEVTAWLMPPAAMEVVGNHWNEIAHIERDMRAAGLIECADLCKAELDEMNEGPRFKPFPLGVEL